jgi:hypothetical protein
MATTRKPNKPSKPNRPTKPDPLTHQAGSHHGEAHDGEHGDREGSANITLNIRLGPMVSFQIEGRNCVEITAALKGFEHLNRTVDAMFSDLAKRVYPDLGPTGKAAD